MVSAPPSENAASPRPPMDHMQSSLRREESMAAQCRSLGASPRPQPGWMATMFPAVVASSRVMLDQSRTPVLRVSSPEHRKPSQPDQPFRLSDSLGENRFEAWMAGKTPERVMDELWCAALREFQSRGRATRVCATVYVHHCLQNAERRRG